MNSDMPGNDEQKGEEARMSSMRALFLATLASLTLIGLAAHFNYANSERARLDFERSAELIQLSNDIRYYDEVLTVSASMAAVAPDQEYAQWEERYKSHALLLKESMDRAVTPTTKEPLAQLEEVNARLNAKEMESFALLAQSKNKEAKQIIASPEYRRLKADSLKIMEQLSSSLHSESQALITQIDNREARARTLRRSGLGLTIGMWLIFAMRNHRLSKMVRSYTQELDDREHYDQLTGVANRALFMDRLRSCFLDRRTRPNEGALLIIDLDNFKTINDVLGHPVGDRVLKTIANRLQEICREADTIARLGGDEFAIIAPDVTTAHQSGALIEKIMEAASQPIASDGNKLLPQVSIGVAFYPADARAAPELLRKADLALFQAKKSGKSQYAHFDMALERAVKHHCEVEKDLRVAIERGEFELYYQPVVRFNDQSIDGVEALVRWNHPHRGIVGPDEFISIAEESRLIIPLGRWIYREACRQHREWLDQGLPALTMSVNLSGVQFEDKELYSGILGALDEYSMDPENLIVEITETTLMSAEEGSGSPHNPIDTLARLGEHGIRVAIDDFGMGYSSFSRLKQLPVHVVKIDRNFVSGIPEDRGDAAIAHAIIRMSGAWNHKVIAEGIENREQLDYLSALNCDYGQGYFLGRPMTASEVAKYLSRKHEFEEMVTTESRVVMFPKPLHNSTAS